MGPMVVPHPCRRLDGESQRAGRLLREAPDERAPDGVRRVPLVRVVLDHEAALELHGVLRVVPVRVVRVQPVGHIRRNLEAPRHEGVEVRTS